MEIAGKKAAVPIWILVFGAVMIVIGLATYGYNMCVPLSLRALVLLDRHADSPFFPSRSMKVLGNKITLHSPSRGFSMELGASITVILASQYGLPVSTTMCITGSTIGVALCNGDLRSINWRAIGWIFLGWVRLSPSHVLPSFPSPSLSGSPSFASTSSRPRPSASSNSC